MENVDFIVIDQNHCDLMYLFEHDRGYLIFAFLKLKGYGAELVNQKKCM